MMTDAAGWMDDLTTDAAGWVDDFIADDDGRGGWVLGVLCRSHGYSTVPHGACRLQLLTFCLQVIP